MLVEVVTYLGAAVALLIVVRLFRTPLKWGLKLIINTLLGFLLLGAFNLLGTYIGVTLGFNLLNALVVGVFGVPGLILLLLARWLL